MNNIKESPLQRSANSGYAVRAEYRPLPNCPTLRYGQLRIAATRCVKFPPIKKPAIRGYGEREKNRGGKNMKYEEAAQAHHTTAAMRFGRSTALSQIALRYASGNFA